MKEFTASCSGQIEQLKQALETADAVLIGAGSGLSTSAGLTYSVDLWTSIGSYCCALSK